MPQLRILYQDENLVAVDKPAGFHVHPPEDQTHRISKNTNTLALLRDQLGRYVYPIHRLDRATSGVVLFGLSGEFAGRIAQQFQDRTVKKTYFALVRGWSDPEGEVDTDLEGQPAVTRFNKIYQMEIPKPLGRFSHSRYSLLEVSPLSGRLHQIRRHLRRISHPIVGDSIYGDGAHNKNMREWLGKRYLYLKAQRLEFDHPVLGQRMAITSPWNTEWHFLFDQMGICPWTKR
jgi:tRNA pseudouridine65 synthase